MANGAGSVAAAAAGIRAPTGSLLGDITDAAGGFLKGVQEEKERKEKQALEDAVHALNVRAQDELERAAGIAEEDVDLSRLLQQAELDEQVRAAGELETDRDLDRPIAEIQAKAQRDIGRAQVTGADRLVEDQEQDQLEEVVAVRALQDQLIALGEDRETVEAYNFQGAEAALASVHERLERERLERGNILTNRTQTRANLNIEIQTIEAAQQRLAQVRAQIIPNRNEEMEAVIEEGLFTTWTDPETGETVDPRTLNAVQRTRLILQMSEEEKGALVDLRRTNAGFRTSRQEEADAVEKEAALNEQMDAALEELNQLRLQAEVEDREVGTDTQIPAGGAAGAAVPGDADAQPIAANPFSPAGDGFIRTLQTDVVGASATLTAFQISADARPDIRPVALEDITARLTLAQRTVEDIHAEAAEIEEERAAAAEEQELAEESPVDRRRRIMRERIARGEPALDPAATSAGTLLGEAFQGMKNLTRGGIIDVSDTAGDGESEPEPEIDPAIEDLERRVQEGAGAKEDQEMADTVAVATLKSGLASLEGQVDFESAKSAVMQLLRLGETRKDSLLAILDLSLRTHVANVIPNRIAG